MVGERIVEGRKVELRKILVEENIYSRGCRPESKSS